MPRITSIRLNAMADVPAASMRPGRNAPDNFFAPHGEDIFDSGFNEAGAKCPG